MASIGATQQFITEVVDELKKVTWPDWPQLKNATLVVLAFVALVILIIWLMDISIRTVLDIILGAFAG